MEGAQGLVRAPVRGGDVDAHAFAAEQLAQFLARLLGLLPPSFGEGQRVVGFALVHGVINIAR